MRINDQVGISLAVAEFRISYGIKSLPLFLLNHRQGPQGLGQERQFTDVDRNFSRSRREYKSFDAHYVAHVNQVLPDLVVKRLVFSRGDVVTPYIKLDLS